MSEEHDFVARTGRTRRGPRDGDDRVARIARFLSANRTRSPRMAVELVLTASYSGQDPDVLARWPKDDVTPDLAADIDALIQDYANDAGCTIGATLAWCLEDGRPHLSKGFRAACRAEEAEVVRPLDGTLSSLLAQNQRHLEATQRYMFERDGRMEARLERILGLYEQTIEKLTDRVAHREDELEQARAHVDHATQIAEDALARAEDAERAAEDSEKSDAMGRVVEIAAGQLMGGTALSKTKP